MAQGAPVPSPHACKEPEALVPGLLAAHATAHTAGRAAGAVRERDDTRPPISASWWRSWEAGVDAGVSSAPLVFDRDSVADARAAHPLDPHLPLLRDLLRAVTDEAEHLIAVTDGTGHVLWTGGPPGVRRQAEVIGLMEGFCWSEQSIGTNGIGTALAGARAEYVYSAEHVVSILHHWSCAGAPITDPDSGRVLGCVDVSATLDRLHPATVGLVAAVARLAEARLEADMHRADERLRERYARHLRGSGVLVTGTGRVLLAEPAAWRGRRVGLPVPGGRLKLPDGRPAIAEPIGEVYLLRPADLRVPGPSSTVLGVAERPLLSLTLLGAEQPVARLDGRPLPLSLRHAEILALLALHPRGLSGDRLSWHLYGDDGSPVTVRAEIHRLRAQLGSLVRAKPYRLECEVEVDFLTARRLLDEGDLAAAVRLYAGELLPRSDAPAIRAERDELAVRLRRQVLDGGTTGQLWDYAQTDSGRTDLEVLERLRTVLPPGDSRQATVAARAGRLLGGDL